MPHVPHLTIEIGKLLKSPTVDVVPYYCKTLNKIFSKLKHKDKLEMKSNIIYDISFGVCSGKYIGLIRTYLKTRLNAHEFDCRNFEKSELSALSQHCHTFRHHFCFHNTKILDIENVFKNDY